MPCKGNEPGLGRNIEAILKQTYGNYHTIIVTDSIQDPAYAVAKSVLTSYPNGRLCTSQPSAAASGKVAALILDQCFCTHICFMYDSMRHSKRMMLWEPPKLYLGGLFHGLFKNSRKNFVPTPIELEAAISQAH